MNLFVTTALIISFVASLVSVLLGVRGDTPGRWFLLSSMLTAAVSLTALASLILRSRASALAPTIDHCLASLPDPQRAPTLSSNETESRPNHEHSSEKEEPLPSPESDGPQKTGERGGLHNAPWLKLIEECVHLLDEVDRYMPDFEPAKQELAEHVIYRVREILERSGVGVIADETSFDRNRHQPENPRAGLTNGAPVAETLSPGFAVGRRVLRRARVRLA
ncbi:MAG TPA: hypothetical protein VEX60_05405 [Pyrinomonadaceae bacterium]|nr:hypothetical protein [Pyrinomonadaceae bacterium]